MTSDEYDLSWSFELAICSNKAGMHANANGGDGFLTGISNRTRNECCRGPELKPGGPDGPRIKWRTCTMCYADKPLPIGEQKFGIMSGKVYRVETIQVPSGHVGFAPTEFRFLGTQVGQVDPICPNRAIVNGQIRSVNAFGGIS